ncbi:LOW QUALITY PROTEIN: hypothetical protein MXB_3622, partial [Myxobolus squamalis]
LNGEPLYLGGPCTGEEKYFLSKDLYRTGAKRWKQIYCYNSHMFHRKRYNKIRVCVICNDIIWGIGRQGVKCSLCKLLVHKNCCDKVIITCHESDNQCVVGIGLKDFDFIRIIGRGSYAKDIDWIQTEKRVLEKVSESSFLVGMHSSFQTGSRLFFVIEFLSGGDLMFHMQRKKKLIESETKFYCAEISSGLDFLHKKRIVYRDLKLDNVLINYNGHVKLTDFGMCKEDVSLYSRASTFCGTPNYIAPEVLKNENYGLNIVMRVSVDWWALGVLTFEMMAGRSPFDVAMAAQNTDLQTEEFLFQMILERDIRIPRFLSVRAADFIKKLMKKEPSERLGCKRQLEFYEFQNHIFFKGINWNDVFELKLKPPYIPKLGADSDYNNFDPIFTSEPIQFTPDDPLSLNEFDQSQFDGFDYINPLYDRNETNN